MGAAGRDFHDFNVAFRDAPAVQVVAFTAAQIPNLSGRRYPPSLAGRLADVVLLAKTGSASPSAIRRVRRNVGRVNSKARIVEADSILRVDDPSQIRGRRVLVVEDGPTVTHGEMPHGAGYLAATRWDASEIVDPRPYAFGSIRETYPRYPHLAAVLPAMGYGAAQMAELKRTIETVPCDLVLIGTPLDLGKLPRPGNS